MRLLSVVLMRFNLVSNNYQEAFKVLSTFVPNKQFGQLITIAPNSSTMLNMIQNFHLLKYRSLIKIASNLK